LVERLICNEEVTGSNPVGSTNAAKSAQAKAYDAQTAANVSNIQKDIVVETQDAPLPNPGTTSTYYCLGKTSSETCTFWGATLHGNDTVASVITSPAPSSKSIVIGGLEYKGAVYKCTEIADGECVKAAIYWALATLPHCPFGLTVVTDSTGVVCGQNAGSQEITYVETGQNESGGGGTLADYSFTIEGPGDITLVKEQVMEYQVIVHYVGGGDGPEDTTFGVVGSGNGDPLGGDASFTFMPESCIPEGGVCYVQMNAYVSVEAKTGLFNLTLEGISSSGVIATQNFTLTVGE
jgi:hypothetical protein